MPAVVELYFYDGWQCVEEQTTSGATKKTFIFGEGIDEVIWARLPDAADLDADMDTGELVDLYCHQNSLDSVMAATEPSGTLADGRAVHFEKLMTAQQQIPKADLTNEHQGDCPPTK